MGTASKGSIRRLIRTVTSQCRDGPESDRDLLRRFAACRDEDAFAALVRRHGAMVRGVALRVLRGHQDAEDVCQATFLLLARKVNIVPWRDSVANWLYGAAYRLALQTRDAANRRNAREIKVRPKPPPDALAEITLRELQTVLDEELARLPRKYRAAILLCCLEGKARDEAAQCLGWTLATIKSRLEEGRELLRRRMASRGLALSAALAGVTLASQAAQAASSAALIHATSRAALQLLAGKAATNVVSPNVIALIQGGARSMFFTKLKVGVALAAAAAAVATVIIALAQDAPATAQAGQPPAREAAEPAAPERNSPQPTTQPSASTIGQPGKAPSEEDSKRTIVLHGKVFGPGDRPVAGARLFLTVDEWTDPIELGTSDVNGSYRFAVPEKKLRRTVSGGFQQADCQASLIATATDLGPAWEELPSVKGNRYGEMKAEYAHDFHLGVDYPIAGRVVDIRGKPVARAVVAVDRIHSLSDGRWHKMHPAIKSGDANFMTREQNDVNGWFSPLYRTAWNMIPPATTDSEGRFRLAGVGSDRAVRLHVTGPGIRSANVSVLTRDDVAGFTQAIRTKWPRARRPHGYFWPEWQSLPDGGESVSVFGPFPKIEPEGDQGVLLFGPSPTIEVDPARTIAGVVRDAATGEPIAGVRINTTDRLGGGVATTDRHGRYRLLRVEKQSSISVYNSPEPERYLTVVRRLTDAEGLGEIVADIDIPRGVVINGRVLEAGTNRPIVSAPRQGCHDIVPGPLVAGNVFYFPLATNAALRGRPTGLYFEDLWPYQRNLFVTVSIDPDGRFRMVVPPGPGVLFAQSSPGMPMFATAMVWKESDGMHRLLPYATLTTRAKDDGAPAGDAQSLPGFHGPIPIANYHAYRVINPPADAKTLDLTLNVPRAPSRMLRFVDPDGRAIRGVHVQGLVAPPASMTVILDGSEAEALALEPGKPREVIATSGDGKYIVKTSVSADDLRPATIRLEPAGSITGRIVDDNGKPVKALLSPDQQTKAAADVGYIPQVRSDADGRFRIVGLLAGLRYSGEIRGRNSDSERVGTAFENVVLRAGEVRDLGDIRIKAAVDAKSDANSGK